MSVSNDRLARMAVTADLVGLAFASHNGNYKFGKPAEGPGGDGYFALTDAVTFGSIKEAEAYAEGLGKGFDLGIESAS